MSLTIKAAQNGVNGVGMATNAVGLREGDGKGKAVFAGTLMVPSETDTLVKEKRQSAQKRAMKLVSDAWGKDQKLLQKIDDKWKLWEDKLTQIKDSENRISDIEEAKARLQQQYEIDPESQEQKDLELLEKYQDRQNGVKGIKFSKEEKERLRKLQYMSRTEYQDEVLKLNDDSGKEKVNIDKLQWQAEIVKGSISPDKIKQEISQDMLKAKDTADEIMDAAGRDIMNLLIQESKDKIDRETEDEKEQAKEAQEKKEEQQEKIEQAREDRKEQQELIEGDLEADKLEKEFALRQRNTSNMEIAQSTIRRMVQENNLTEEDLKGIEIDFGF